MLIICIKYNGIHAMVKSYYKKNYSQITYSEMKNK